jgi:hypothetical protein
MNNKQENSELQQATAAATPPPFRPSEEPQEATQQQPGASPTLDDRISALGLDEEATGRLQRLTQGMDPDSISPDLLETLARGITHDNDVENADAAGYLRGRNEKIEAVLHPEPEDDAPQSQPVFPRYCHRSIWD